MIGKALASAAALALVASPCAAAELGGSAFEAGQRHSGAAAGVYFAVPFGGQRSGRAQAGLRVQAVRDYRDASGARTRLDSIDTFELRLLGERRPTLFVASQPVTGRHAGQNLMGGGIVNIVVIGLAVVGAVVIYKAIDDDDEVDFPT